mmetsp:Transcript_830/g.1076  ORF Transcript_830/g.1076 Transcript_830/m.1076 type:complete len:270 (-) Transcript_830:47-856(-)
MFFRSWIFKGEEQGKLPFHPRKKFLWNFCSRRVKWTHLGNSPEKKCQSWSECKRLSRELQGIANQFQSIEQKMIRMEELTKEEKGIYETVSQDQIEEKIEILNGKMKDLVLSEMLTARDKQNIVRQIDEKINDLVDNSQKNNLKARRTKISAIPAKTHPIFHAKDFQEIFLKLQKIDELEAIKGRLLTMQEGKIVGEKPELEEKLNRLIESDRGWYEDEEDFQKRLDSLKNKAMKSKSKVNKEIQPKESLENSWQTVGTNKGSAKYKKK